MWTLTGSHSRTQPSQKVRGNHSIQFAGLSIPPKKKRPQTGLVEWQGVAELSKLEAVPSALLPSAPIANFHVRHFLGLVALERPS